jgi:hypothetical protein
MALMQLITHYNTCNENIYVVENTEHIFEDNGIIKTHTISSGSDRCIPKYLIFNLNSNITIQEFINLLDNSTLNITINGESIIYNRLSLYMIIEPIQLEPNVFSIEIPYSKLNNHLYIRSLKNSVQLILNLSEEFNKYITSCSVMLESIYMNLTLDKLVSMKNDPHMQYIQKFQSHYIKLAEPSNIISTELNFTSLSKGFLIESDISNIKNIKLYFNGHERWNLSSSMIKLNGKSIANKNGVNLYWLGFNPNVNFFDTENSFLSSTHCEMLEIVIKFEMINMINMIGIHSLGLVKLNYTKGDAYYSYIYDNKNDIYEEIISNITLVNPYEPLVDEPLVDEPLAKKVKIEV